MNAFEALKAFCTKEGLFYAKFERDTNNGKLVTLQVSSVHKMSKSFGKFSIFRKSKWCASESANIEKMIQMLSADFFTEVGVSTFNVDYWGVGQEAEEKTPSQPKKKKVKKQKKAVGLDKQIDKILSEEGSDETPESEDLSETLGNLVGGISDKSPAGLFEALSTEGGLEEVGRLLQNPNMTKMISPMMAMMGGMGMKMPNFADMMKMGSPGFFPKMVPKATPINTESMGEAAEDVPLVHTPETPEVVEADE